MTRFHGSLATILAVLGCLQILGCTQAAEKATIQKLDANGVKIVYFVQGKGEPVVLIHGWLSSAGINLALPGTSDLLSKDYQVIALDVR